jgi:hypothetical protein
MANWRRPPADALRTLDRALGGQRRPTRIQKWVARHPIGTGLCVAVPVTLFSLMPARGEEPHDPLFAVAFGPALGLVFALTAASERLRQRRLKRPGIWDGS